MGFWVLEMLIKCKSLVGRTYEIGNVEPTDKVAKLKSLLTEQILGKPAKEGDEVRAFKIKLVYRGKPLSDDLSLGESGVNDGDQMVAIPSRQKPVAASVPPPPPVTSESILEATSQQMDTSSSLFESDSTERPTDPVQLRAQLQDLLASLVGAGSSEGEPRDRAAVIAAAAALAAASNASRSAQPAGGAGGEAGAGGSGAVNIQIDPNAIRQLMDMGFGEERAKKALLLNRLNIDLAMDWLFEHENDADADTPLTEEQINQLMQAEANFVPDPSSVQQLQEMGFGLEDITAALRATNNNYEMACAWLLGDRDVSVNEQEDTNPLIGAILSNPAVLAGLRNPRVLQAFQAMIENPAAGQQYVNDPEIGPILCEVNRIIRNADA